MVTLAPPVPTGVDPGRLQKAAAGLSATGGLTFYVEDAVVTYSAAGTSVLVDEGRDHGATAVRLDRRAWDDLVAQVRTFIGLYLSDELTFERGRFEQLADWDPVLRYLHAGLPPYDPSGVDFEGRDPAATFDVGTDDAELAAQLRVMGYLHVKGVFSVEEMDEANREVDRLAALARPGDDQSWWVTSEDGSKSTVPARLCQPPLPVPRRARKRPPGPAVGNAPRSPPEDRA